MGLYRGRVLPRLIDAACGVGDVDELRRALVPLARGQVLEVGMGAGHNLVHYDRDRVETVWAVEPSAGMRRMAERRLDAATADLDVRVLPVGGERIPLADGSIDTVVLTYTLCSIADWRAALGEMRRVLAPDGTLLFCEHGAAPDPRVRRWQRRLTPFWKRVAGGCHLDRPIDRCLTDGGFAIDRLEAGYRPGPRLGTYTYRGAAHPA